MSVYRKFGRNDILFSSVHTRPHTSVTWNNGWSGGPNGSGSLSLYAGIRARTDTFPNTTSGISIYPQDQVDSHSIDKVVFVSGSYPATGSIRFIRARDQAGTPDNQTVWYEEHFRPIRLLYSYYHRLDSCFFTGSYDRYCLYFPADHTASLHNGSLVDYVNVGNLNGMAGTGQSWTAETWYKPAQGDVASRRHIMQQIGSWRMIVGANNELVLGNNASGTFVQGSPFGSVTNGQWHHLAIAVSGGISASFYVDGVLTAVSGVSQFFGNNQDVTIGADTTTYVSGADGFIFESRIWNTARTATQISSSMLSTLTNSGSSGLLMYLRFNDGPLHPTSLDVAGSGVIDWSSYGSANSFSRGMINLYSSIFTPSWMPNDHPTFSSPRRVVPLSSALGDFRVAHIPSLFYGKQIDPGSVVIRDGAFNGRNIVRVLNDDGRGCLYLSGSVTRRISGEEYTGDTRHKVGNVFYSEGLIVITDPGLWDMFDSSDLFWLPATAQASGTFAPLIGIEFSGQGKVHTKTFNCRLGTSQANASNNPTFSSVDSNGVLRPVRDDGITYITAVGLYNEDRTLVAVAKLAAPLRKREKDKQNIRLKLDF